MAKEDDNAADAFEMPEDELEAATPPGKKSDLRRLRRQTRLHICGMRFVAETSRVPF